MLVQPMSSAFQAGMARSDPSTLVVTDLAVSSLKVRSQGDFRSVLQNPFHLRKHSVQL